MDLILASASPRRRDLLEMLGLCARQIPAEVDETLAWNTPLPEAVIALAERKAAAVAADYPQSLILAADTLVAHDGRLFGKPKDAEDALMMLTTLAGTTHHVATGFCLRRGEEMVKEAVVSQVQMRRADHALLKAYVASGEPFGKAGAYAVQGRGAVLVERIDGDFFNVVGLPVAAVAQALRQFAETDFLQAFAGRTDGTV